MWIIVYAAAAAAHEKKNVNYQEGVRQKETGVALVSVVPVVGKCDFKILGLVLTYSVELCKAHVKIFLFGIPAYKQGITIVKLKI